MAAPKKNQFWRQRCRSGPKQRFDCAKKLTRAILSAVDWHADNPIKITRHAAFKGEVFPYVEEKIRVVTLESLCTRLGVTVSTWHHWRKNRHDLKEVIEWAENAIYAEKFHLAAAGVISAKLIAMEMAMHAKSYPAEAGATHEEFLLRAKRYKKPELESEPHQPVAEQPHFDVHKSNDNQIVRTLPTVANPFNVSVAAMRNKTDI